MAYFISLPGERERFFRDSGEIRPEIGRVLRRESDPRRSGPDPNPDNRGTHPSTCRERGLSESVPPPRTQRRLGNAWTRRSWRSRTAPCSRHRRSPRWWWRRPRLRIGHVWLHEKGWEREHPVGSWKSSHHPSIYRHPTFARAARWWRRGAAAIAASALATQDSARILPSPRCSVDLEARFRRRRRARCWLPPGIFGERSTATRRTDQYRPLEFPARDSPSGFPIFSPPFFTSKMWKTRIREWDR